MYRFKIAIVLSNICLIILMLGCQEGYLTPNEIECEHVRGNNSGNGYPETEADGEFYFFDPEFNPINSNEFVFSYTRPPNEERRIGIGDLRTRTFRDIAPGQMPTWSSKGLIAFVGKEGIWTVKPNGDSLKKILQKSVIDPSWSRDGETIAFAGRISGATWGLFLVDKNGENLVENVRAGGTLKPVWLMDGSKILSEWADVIYIYSFIEDNYFEVEPRNKSIGDIIALTWGPNANQVWLSSDQGVFVIDIDLKTETLIRENCWQGKSYQGMSISPNGQKVLFSRIDQRRQNRFTLQTAIKLWLMDMDGSNEELIELTKE